MSKKITREINGKLYDIYVIPDGHVLINIRAFEVIRPHREWFGRTKWVSTYERSVFVGDVKTANDIVKLIKEYLDKEESRNNDFKVLFNSLGE